MKKTTREWVKKAEQDYVLAQQSSRSKVPVHDGVCFHSQQGGEKYLKGLMEECGLTVPKTHDLDVLLTALVPHHPTLRSLRRGLLFLSGRMAPLALFPASVQAIAAVSPFRWMMAFPVEVLLGKLAPQDVVNGLLAQMAWVALSLVAMSAVWRVGIKRYTAVGA